MKNLKKLIALLAALTLTAAVLTGCGSSGSDKRSADNETAKSISSDEKETESDDKNSEITGMLNKSDRLMGMDAEQIMDAFYQNDLAGVLTYDNGTYGMPETAVTELNEILKFMTKEEHFSVVGNAEAKDSYLVYVVDEVCGFDCIAMFEKNSGNLISTSIYDIYKGNVSYKSVSQISDGTLDIEGFDIGFPRKWNSPDDSTFGSYQLTLPDVEVLCNAAKQDTVDTMNKIMEIVENNDAHGIMREVEIVRGLGKPSQRVIDMGFASENEPEFELPGISNDEAELRRLQRLMEAAEEGRVSVATGEEALGIPSSDTSEP